MANTHLIHERSNSRSFHGTPSYLASIRGCLEIVRLLLGKGSRFSVPNNIGYTPLHNASNNGYLEVVKLLLEKGADITAADGSGWTALYTASESGHPEIVRLLLDISPGTLNRGSSRQEYKFEDNLGRYALVTCRNARSWRCSDDASRQKLP
jgi:ankyrin repeat protein